MRSVSSTKGQCFINPTNVVCNAGSLGKQIQHTISLVLVPDSAGKITVVSRASVPPPNTEVDPNATNDEKIIEVIVN